MTKRGRPRKPRAVTEKLGNPGHRPLRDEPTPITRTAPTPPAWLSPYALEEWSKVVPELTAMGLAAEIDQAAIAAHCENVSLMRNAAEVLAEMSANDASRGLLAKMPSGAVVQNPVLGTFNKARRDVLRSCSELGLSAAGRAGLEAPAGDAGADAVMRKYFGGDDD
jgi:P27 family predicted phage terminase small subunit